MNYYRYQYGQDSECKTPIEECTAKGGPQNCRWHKGCHFDLYDASDVGNLNIDDVAKDYIEIEGEKVSQEEKEKISKCMGEVLSSLTSRFQEIRIPKFHLICARFKRPGVAGLSRLDRIITPEPFVCMGIVNEEVAGKGYSYCHGGKAAQSDASRHELGHVLTTKDVLDEYLSITGRIINRYGMTAFDKYVKTAISQYAYEYGPKEEIAELFSIVTDDDESSKSKIIPELVRFVELNMLNSKSRDKDGRPISMDELKEMKNDKFYIPPVIIDNFSEPPSPELKWDSESGEWIKKTEWGKRRKRGRVINVSIKEQNDWVPSKELELAIGKTDSPELQEDDIKSRYE